MILLVNFVIRLVSDRSIMWVPGLPGTAVAPSGHHPTKHKVAYVVNYISAKLLCCIIKVGQVQILPASGLTSKYGKSLWRLGRTSGLFLVRNAKRLIAGFDYLHPSYLIR